jgi:hypothetical protein
MKRVIRRITKPPEKPTKAPCQQCSTCDHWLDTEDGKPRERTVCMGPESPFYCKVTAPDTYCDQWKEDKRYELARMKKEHRDLIKSLEKQYGIVLKEKS